MIYFNTNLKYLLKLLRVRQETLASFVGVRSTTISNYVNKVSSPAVDDLAKICQYFGVSVDSLLFQNYSAGKLITEEDVENFKTKGKLLGKQLVKKNRDYALGSQAETLANEPDENILWVVLQALRQMDSKLDGVQEDIKSLLAKK